MNFQATTASRSLLLAALSIPAGVALANPGIEEDPEQFVYQNPVVSTVIDGGIRDPDIIRWEGRYYLTGTTYPFSRGARTGVRLWSSGDLKNWKGEG